MPRKPVDLSAHINHDVRVGHPADFPVQLMPVYCAAKGDFDLVPNRRAVVRADSGLVLGVVSDRYKLVPHQRILDVIDSSLSRVDAGPAPRGIYVDRGGARMRALYKFPALAETVSRGDDICPCLKVVNTYDGTGRIGLHIGAFRFVCTNLAVGGGGVFAGGFVSVHAGDIPLDEVGDRLASYLRNFEAIVRVYRAWHDMPFDPLALRRFYEELPHRTAAAVENGIGNAGCVFAAYNGATYVATHEMRSAPRAFDLLEKINATFQAQFPARPLAISESTESKETARICSVG